MINSTISNNVIKRYFPSVIAFLAVMMVTVVFVVVAYSIQQRYTLRMFDGLAERQADVLQEFLENDLEFIGAGANFYHSVDRAYWHQFPIYARQVVNGSASLISLQWMQKVSAEELPAHTEKMRVVFPGYTPYTVPKNGNKISGYLLEGNQPVFIASDVYPRDKQNIEVMGFYSSRQRFSLILDDITQNGRANVSDKVRLLQDGIDKSVKKNGMLIYHPVFDRQDHSLLGVVIGVVRTSVYFDELISSTSTEINMLVKVMDLGFEADDDPVLFQSDGWESKTGRVLKKYIELPNRQWSLEFKLSDTLSAWDQFILYAIALTGVLIASLISYIINLQTREKERIAEMLDKKTLELKIMAERDPLTHLRNRRVFNRYLRKFIDHDAFFALIGFDIDHFKQINDEFGHLVGDQTLVHVTGLVKESLHGGDPLFRTGGDEFCILSRVGNKRELAGYLEKLREKVSSTPFQWKGASINCSLSIGAVLYAGEDPTELYHKMDVQMYNSKEKGRNSVSIAD
ncbi:sensor domain-containing diguanylate cyclase [Vibrio sp. CAU 1672]|uniref:sensor domain-containing diguanylate cyclase n=1 Tax=Vibrio sp. CAU 1672 TaxID=3032594 RepID=UPI0023D98F48|nr:sensor domain-containing diguanylate cyclase [Vibrio sp. CAU 1672]MDF2154653.1 sensor domain-containing diguanylate cyclase [Vibrio sp. CAU 1672]